MKILLLDCYVDEPSCLGVPPYISPYVRYAAGAVRTSGHELTYMTIDEYRGGSPKLNVLKKANTLIMIGGGIVPGKYLRGTPASINEIKNIAEDFKGIKILGGPIAKFWYSGNRSAEKLREIFDFVPSKDLDAFIIDFLTQRSEEYRWRSLDEWRRWALEGSVVIEQHPDFPLPLIIELETYKGCVRYFTGGCSFCIEPLYGKPQFRPPVDIVDEVRALSKVGAINFRLGTQSCMFSYGTKQLGSSETPKPEPSTIISLLKGIREAAPNLEVLHTDNANPAVIAEHPNEAKEILKALVRYCTSGNVLALGMESADPSVIEANHLNATPEQVMRAIKLINEAGGERGDNGLPKLLPGINLLSGLKGETTETFDLNLRFLKEVLEHPLLLRRINIRQVASVRTDFDMRKLHRQFLLFKRKVRDKIDNEMLKLLIPEKTVLRRVFIEKLKGNISYGRQIGTYPLLVGIPYKVKENSLIDVMVTDHGFRSVTGLQHPMNVNNASLKALSSLPNIGKKRAARIARARPFRSKEELLNCLDNDEVGKNLLEYIDI